MEKELKDLWLRSQEEQGWLQPVFLRVQDETGSDCIGGVGEIQKLGPYHYSGEGSLLE